ncbi:MAG: PAS domain S-box protein [Gemmatimonadetes bacterium]|nr:PAS domain S-box protein [Gemmatimonadota bacterium]
MTARPNSPDPSLRLPLAPRAERFADQGALLAAVVASSAEAIYTVTHDGRITSWNPGATRLYGYEEVQLLGQSIAVLAEPAEAERWLATLATLRTPQPAAHLEAVHRTREGHAIDVWLTLSPVQAADGAPAVVAVIARDITARRLEEEQFRLALEANPLGLLLVDAAGRIRMMNGTAERLFGYPREELLDEPIDRLLPAAMREAHAAARSRYREVPTPRVMHERAGLVALDRSGREFPVEVALTPLITRRGPMVLATVRDVTELRAAEAREAATRRELQRSNQELTTFAYVASHDLQEPLRMVASYSRLLIERYGGRLDERGEKYLGYVRDGAERMQQLVSSLLALSRVDTRARPFRAVDAGLVLSRVRNDLMARVLATGATVHWARLPVVLADEVQLGQVFLNLLGNALKFVAERTPVIEVTAVPDPVGWRFRVTDNGIGMEPEFAADAFQLFRRLHARDSFEGSGIGLALVKRIVERHGGTIGVDSRLGEGSSFWFTLPGVAAS